MIQLNKNSWYMQATRKVYDHHPDNLCQLIRYMAGALVIYIVLAIFAGLLISLALYPLAYLTPFTTNYIFFATGLCFDSFVLILILRQVVNAYGWKQHWLNTDIMPHVDVTEISFVQVICAWFKAIHDKTCPLITYKS